MPDPIVCPHCREELDIPAEYHGRQVRCANCQNVFVATPGGDTPVVHRLPGRAERESDRPPWQDDDRPRRARRDDEHDDRPPRRSNAGVWLLMALTLFTFGGCCGGLNVLMLVQVNPTLTPYESEKGKFKVEFPGENPADNPITNPADLTLEGVQVTARREFGQERYAVRCYDLKAEWRKLPAEDALVKVAEAELTLVMPGVKAEREQKATHDGFEARDVIAGTGTGLARRELLMRCILAGRRVYVVQYEAQQAQTRFWWVQKYFVSFEITDPKAKPKKKED